MNLLEQLGNRPPTKVMRHLCSNLEINARDEQASASIDEARNIPQTAPRSLLLVHCSLLAAHC